MTEKTEDLVAEARRWANGHPNRRSGELMRDLADALAAQPVLDPEKVAEVAEQAGDEWQTMFDQFMLGRGADPGPLYPFIARALCEAYTEGKLT